MKGDTLKVSNKNKKKKKEKKIKEKCIHIMAQKGLKLKKNTKMDGWGVGCWEWMGGSKRSRANINVIRVVSI